MPITALSVASKFESSPDLTAALIGQLRTPSSEPLLLKMGITELLSTLENDVREQEETPVSLPIDFIKRHLRDAYPIAQVAILCHAHWNIELNEERCHVLTPFLPILSIARSFIKDDLSFQDTFINEWDDFLALLEGISIVVNELFKEEGITIYLPPNNPDIFLAHLKEFASPDQIRNFAIFQNDYYALIEAFGSGDADLMHFAIKALRSVDGPAGYACCFPRLMQRIAEMEEVDRHFMINNWVKALGLSQAREELAEASPAILSHPNRNIILTTLDSIECELEQIDRRDATPPSSRNMHFFSNQESRSAVRQFTFSS